jgi:hypothetical protein
MGIVTVLSVLVVALVLYVLLVSAGAQVLATVLLLIPIVLAFVFGSLIVQVDKSHLRIRFGIGLIRRAWPLREIVSVERVRNPWYTGWGIRLLPGRTVYNVSGFDAVEITLVNGKRYRIGTNQPAELERAIRSRMRS